MHLRSFLYIDDLLEMVLSIPVAWDFSMHLREHMALPANPDLPYGLSIPVAWDFSMHLTGDYTTKVRTLISFNSRCLGFFHASGVGLGVGSGVGEHFQFPLLGIFPCIAFVTAEGAEGICISFNSRCLGFFHASRAPPVVTVACVDCLSIPVAWDFSMHLNAMLTKI